MGFFDSKSTVENRTRTQNAGFSEIGGDAFALGDGNSLTLTDQGALDVANNIATQSLRQVELAGQNSVDTVGQAVEAVAESAREESENLVGNFKTVAIMAVIAWAIVGFAKGLKA